MRMTRGREDDEGTRGRRKDVRTTKGREDNEGTRGRRGDARTTRRCEDDEGDEDDEGNEDDEDDERDEIKIPKMTETTFSADRTKRRESPFFINGVGLNQSV